MAVFMHPLGVHIKNSDLAVSAPYGDRSLHITGEMHRLAFAWIDAIGKDAVETLPCCSVKQMIGWRLGCKAKIYLERMPLGCTDTCLVIIEREALLVAVSDDIEQIAFIQGASRFLEALEQGVDAYPSLLVQRKACDFGAVAQDQCQKLAMAAHGSIPSIGKL